MIKAEGKFLRQKDSLPYAAIVQLSIDENSIQSKITFNLNGTGWTGQGSIETATDTNATIVAAATAYAVWNAEKYLVSNDLKEKIESVVFKSWKSKKSIQEQFEGLLG